MTLPLDQSLEQSGYAIARGCVPTAVLQTLRQQRDQVLSDLPSVHRETYQSQGSLVNLGDHPQFSKLIALPELRSLLQSLGLKDVRWLAGYLISKPPNSPALFWHQDWWGWDHDSSYTPQLVGLGAMIYLSDTSIENDCLRVIPGSHRCQHTLHSLPVAHEQALSTIDDPKNIAYRSDASEAAVAVSAGDVVLIDPRLLHSAYANQSKEERSLLTLWYLPNFTSLPESIQARYVQIFNRQELDTGDSNANDLFDDWPESHRLAIQNLVPIYGGDAEPHPWNRAPDQNRMLASLDHLSEEQAETC